LATKFKKNKIGFVGKNREFDPRGGIGKNIGRLSVNLKDVKKEEKHRHPLT